MILKIKMHLGLALIAAVCLVSFSGCGVGEPKTVKTKDGKFQVTIPGNWSSRKDLNDEAQLQVALLRQEMYLIVLSETRSSLRSTGLGGISIEKHSEITREALMQNAAGAKATGPTEVTIDGQKGIQYEIRGKVEGINAVYLHTTVEIDGQIHQILAWTLASKFEGNKENLQKVIKSFQSVSSKKDDAKQDPPKEATKKK